MGVNSNDYDFFDLDYERDLNLLYVEINPTIKTGITKTKKQIQRNKISNLAIYEIEKNSLSYFFKEESKNDIKFYFYENFYNEKEEMIEFNRDSYHISNNNKIEKRALENKLFVINEKKEGDEYELWISSKLGTDKKLVKVFSKKVEWKIDVYNKKILFLSSTLNGISIESINW